MVTAATIILWEQHGERRLAARETAIEEADTWDDEPDNEAAEHEVCVMVFKANILRVDVDSEDIAAIGRSWVEGGLRRCQSDVVE